MAVSQSLKLTQVSQDIQNNTSLVRILWQSTQTGGSYNETRRTATYYVSINNGEYTAYDVEYTLPYRSTKTIVDITIPIPHTDDGRANVKVRTWMNTNISAGIVQLSQALDLDPIPRQSTISATDGFIEGTSVLSVIKSNASYEHSIHYQFVNTAGWVSAEGEPQEEEVIFSASTIDFKLPESFYLEIPAAPDAMCLLTITTYSNGEQVGEKRTTKFKISANPDLCLPHIDGTITDINPLTVSLSGDNQKIIRQFSTARCQATVTGKNYAVITQCSINGTSGEVLDIEEYDGTPVVFVATDSRGFSSSVTIEPTVVPYFSITGKASIARETPTSNAGDLTISGTFFNGSFGLASNTISASYQVGADAPVQIDVEAVDNEYAAAVIIPNLDYNQVYNITVTISDSLTTILKRLTLKKGVPVFDWGENDFAFHVPVAVEGDVSAQSFSVGGKALWETIYPVGAVYISTQATDPGVLFGGTWAKITDRFLLAAGETYPAGSQGGEAEHTLTVQEIPSHAHTSYGWVYAGQSSGSVVLRADGESEEYSTREAGGNAPHNNMPPYLAVYMWRRTA